jgi:hypothetical protein
MNAEFCVRTVVPLIGNCESLENIIAHQQIPADLKTSSLVG